MRCPRCDAARPPAALHCPGCGALADEPPPPPETDALPGAFEASPRPRGAVRAASRPRAAAGLAAPPPAPAFEAARPPERARGQAALPLGGSGEAADGGGAGAAPDPQLPSGLDRYREVLGERFGFPDFRPGQAEVLERLAEGDVLGVMPTGGGKSLCYVLPALEIGRTLVVSPLIALMQDQVEALRANGVAASFVNSTLGRDEQRRRYLDFAEGRTALLYAAPERLANPRFAEGLRRAGVRLLAVDEAHCISEWGHDFRPDYLALGAARERLGRPRTLALTATADPVVRRDIRARLGIDAGAEVLTGFDRPNLRFAVVPIGRAADRLAWLVAYARRRRGQSGIVYARTRRSVEETAEALRAAGVPARGYHAGMGPAARASIQRGFTTGETPLIVATNAFGLGIDKPDVRFVVHLQMPGRLEAYYQEAGRAGRDGDPAECTLLYARRDHALQRRFIDQAHPRPEEVRETWRRLAALQRLDPRRVLQHADFEDAAGGEGWPQTAAALRASGLVEPGGLRLLSLDENALIDTSAIEARRRHAESRLAQMAEYAETPGCRRALVLRYFGERPAAASCGGCDNCEAPAAARGAGADGAAADGGGERAPDYPAALFADLLALRDRIARESGRPPYMVFEERTAREIATFRPDGEEALLAIWGMGATRVRWFGGRLLAAVREWESAHPDAPAPPPSRPASRPARRARAADAAAGPEVAFDDPLFQRLRDWRRERARSEGVPAYTFFTDRTARELAARRPSDRAGLATVWGFGDSRIEAIGDELLALIAETEPEPTAAAR